MNESEKKGEHCKRTNRIVRQQQKERCEVKKKRKGGKEMKIKVKMGEKRKGMTSN